MFKRLSDILSSKASLFIILTAVVTFFFPQIFAWVKGNTQTIILGIIMLTMGLTLTPKDFKLLAQRPFDILIGAAAQFTIMPLVAFTLSWLFSQVPAFAPYCTAMAIGIILVGCCPGVSVICLACIVGGVITTVYDPLVENGIVLFLLTFCMVFIHNTTGYLLGYSVGRLFHFSTAKKRTLSIEVGMQNAGLGTNLAMTFFVATNPMAVVPCAISCAWHSISGTILANIFARRNAEKRT